MPNLNDLLGKWFGFSELPAEEQTKRRSAIELAIFALIGGLGYNLIYGYLIFPEKNWVSISSLLAFIIAIAFYFFSKNYKIYKLILLSIFVIFGIIAQISLGGFVDESGVVLCCLLPALGALIFDEFKTAQIFFYLFIAACIITGLWEYYYGSETYRFPRKISITFFVANFIFIGGICFFLIRSFYQKMNAFQIDLKDEKEKSENLILNILPATIASELKETGSAKARNYSSVSVIFSDIVGFSKHSKHLNPDELVQQLDSYFSAFDSIMDKIRH